LFSGRRDTEATLRSADRRKREDEARRLHEEVPHLDSLVLTFKDGVPGASGAVEHVRRVPVTSAPALFEPTCQNRDCKGGGHDITREIMDSLHRGMTRFEGSDECGGSSGSAPCRFVLAYVGVATYKAR
jgi:hypothetical protein